MRIQGVAQHQLALRQHELRGAQAGADEVGDGKPLFSERKQYLHRTVRLDDGAAGRNLIEHAACGNLRTKTRTGERKLQPLAAEDLFRLSLSLAGKLRHVDFPAPNCESHCRQGADDGGHTEDGGHQDYRRPTGELALRLIG